MSNDKYRKAYNMVIEYEKRHIERTRKELRWV